MLSCLWLIQKTTVKLKVYYKEEKENYGFWNTYVVTLEKTKKLKTFIQFIYMNGIELLLLVISYLIYSLLLNFIVLFEMIFPKKEKEKKNWISFEEEKCYFHNKKLSCSCHQQKINIKRWKIYKWSPKFESNSILVFSTWKLKSYFFIRDRRFKPLISQGVN